MPVNYANNITALNRLKVALGNTAITPAAGASVDGQNSNGQLVIGNSSLSGAVGVLSTLSLMLPSFSFSGRVATLSGLPLTGSASNTGTAALAEIRDHSGITIISGLTVGNTTGTDIIINTTSLTIGELIICTSGTLTG